MPHPARDAGADGDAGHACEGHGEPEQTHLQGIRRGPAEHLGDEVPPDHQGAGTGGAEDQGDPGCAQHEPAVRASAHGGEDEGTDGEQRQVHALRRHGGEVVGGCGPVG